MLAREEALAATGISTLCVDGTTSLGQLLRLLTFLETVGQVCRSVSTHVDLNLVQALPHAA